MSLQKNYLIQTIIDLLPYNIPDDFILLKQLRSKKIYMHYGHYTSITSLKYYYDKIILYTNNPGHFLILLKESLLSDVAPDFYTFPQLCIDFYSLFVELLKSILESKSGDRHQIICRFADPDFLAPYITKYDYYFQNRLIDKIGPYSFPFSDINILPSKKGFFLHDDQNIITVYNLKYEVISQFKIPNHTVYKLFVAKDGTDTIIIQTHVGIQIWGFATGKQVSSVSHFLLPKVIYYSDNGDPILVFGYDTDIIMINLETQEEIMTFTGTDATIHNIIYRIIVLKDKLIAITGDAVFKLWDMNYPDKPILTKSIDRTVYTCVDFLDQISDNKLLFQVGCYSPQIWNIHTNQFEKLTHLGVGNLRRLDNGYFINLIKRRGSEIGQRSDDLSFDLLDPHGTYIYTSQKIETTYESTIDTLLDGSIVVFNGKIMYIFDFTTGKVLRTIYIMEDRKAKILPNGHLAIEKQDRPYFSTLHIYE